LFFRLFRVRSFIAAEQLKRSVCVDQQGLWSAAAWRSFGSPSAWRALEKDYQSGAPDTALHMPPTQ
jgi:hypothetical protein